MIIREMILKDVPAVALIEQECFSMPWSEKSFCDSISREDTIFLVCEEELTDCGTNSPKVRGGRIVGYIGMYLSFEEGEITNVAVSSSYRKRGYGQRLIQAAKDKAADRNIKSILLEVRKSNASAVSLYRRNGFEQVGIRKNFYERPAEDAIIMKVGI